MNTATREKLSKALWFVTAVSALCVGLGAMNLNVMGMLHIEGLDQVLRYLVGIAGLASLVMFFKTCSSGKC